MSCDTTQWLVVKHRQGRPYLEDRGRFLKLVESLPRNAAITHNPCLVSFVGVGNSKKTGVLRSLVAQATDRAEQVYSDRLVAQSDVDAYEREGIHLYIDPSTMHSRQPMLFADCTDALGKGLRAKPGQRTMDSDGSQLYYHLLYTTSDCIVFVLADTTLSTLAEFRGILGLGAAIVNTKLSPTDLPGCILVFCQASSYTNETVQERSERSWRDVVDQTTAARTAPLSTVLACYYRTPPSIVQIQARPPYHRVGDEVSKLRDEISNICAWLPGPNGAPSRRNGGVSLRACVQNTLFVMSRDRPELTRSVSFPLFRRQSLAGFNPHVIHLCTAVEVVPDQLLLPYEEHVHKRLHNLATLLASCAFLECCRHRRGLFEDWIGSYTGIMVTAFREYLAKRQRVLQQSASPFQTDHDGAEDSLTSFSHNETLILDWTRKLEGAMHVICINFRAGTDLSQRELKQYRMAQQVFNSGTADLSAIWLGSTFSNLTCLRCLNGHSEHTLRCGHAICAACAEDIGMPQFQSSHIILIPSCPLHPSQSTSAFREPQEITFKQAGMGARVLILESSGSRVMVQLEILQAVEAKLCRMSGCDVRLVAMFDLIVAEGSSALAAVLLARRSTQGIRTVERCADDMIDLLSEPPSERLRQAVGEKRLFGGAGTEDLVTRVAFLCEPDEQGVRTMHANYRRSEREGVVCPEEMHPKTPEYTAALPTTQYRLARCHNPEDEITVWQAVSASMACSPHERSRNGFAHVVVTECSKIWPDIQPDVVLNVGSGRPGESNESRRASFPTARAAPCHPSDVRSRFNQAGQRRWYDLDTPVKSPKQNKIFKGVKRLTHASKASSGLELVDAARFRTLARSTMNESKRLPEHNRLTLVIDSLIRRIIASSFYISFEPAVTLPGQVLCSICCRYQQGAQQTLWLIKIIDRYRTDDFTPCFVFRPDTQNSFKVVDRQSLRKTFDGSGFQPKPFEVPSESLRNLTSCYLCLNKGDLDTHRGDSHIGGSPRMVARGSSQPQTTVEETELPSDFADFFDGYIS